MGRMYGHRCHRLHLVSPTPRQTLFGAAVAIFYFPSCSADLDPTHRTLADRTHGFATRRRPRGLVATSVAISRSSISSIPSRFVDDLDAGARSRRIGRLARQVEG